MLSARQLELAPGGLAEAGGVALLLDLPQDGGVDGRRRRAFLMEIDALYCDVIVQRWEHFTGRKAARVTAAREKDNEIT